MGSILQIIINSIISGVLLTLVAYGFSIIFNVTKVFHIAHGGIYVVGVYLFILFNSFFQNSITFFILSLTFSFILVSAIAWLIERYIYYPLYQRSSNQLISLISSLGIYIVLINIIAMYFGNETKILTSSTAVSYSLGNIIVTSIQLNQLIIGLIIFILLWSLFKYLNIETKIRAVSDNSLIANVIGIKVKKIRVLVLIAGSLLAVIGALLRSYEFGIDPYSGMSITLTAAAVVILTGNINLLDLLLVAIFISLLQNFSEWYLTAQWKDAITFAFLLVVMFFRTEGILSFSIRKDYS